MLLHLSMSFDVRDTMVDELVARSRAKGGAWTVGVAGVLPPGLRRAVWPLEQSCPGKAADIETGALAAFLVAELIAATRIGDVELADVANALGIS